MAEESQTTDDISPTETSVWRIEFTIVFGYNKEMNGHQVTHVEKRTYLRSPSSEAIWEYARKRATELRDGNIDIQPEPLRITKRVYVDVGEVPKPGTEQPNA